MSVVVYSSYQPTKIQGNLIKGFKLNIFRVSKTTRSEKINRIDKIILRKTPVSTQKRETILTLHQSQKYELQTLL